jgi:twitching motility protein PilT
MHTFNQSLAGLFLRRLITMDEALARSSDHDELRSLIANPQQAGIRPVSQGAA